MPIVSVTEVIEVIGYQLWRGVLWPYLAWHLGKYRSRNPENWIRRHIREAYQNDGSTLEISGILDCQKGRLEELTSGERAASKTGLTHLFAGSKVPSE